ncbi:MAG: CHASE2 domain-containing protein [Candidatus Adiutrix sp.]|jgi:adenylate cyclase|nr:CHASE2 domain-containing protein [Candidatus Adiutrix sp.]
MLKFCRLQARNLKGRFLKMDPRRPRLVLAAALTISFLASLLCYAPFGAMLLDDVYDLMLKAKARLAPRFDRPEDSPLVIVAFDDYTLSYGPLSMPELFRHHYYAVVVKALREAGAHSVVLTRLLPRSRQAYADAEEIEEWFETVRESREMPILSGLIWRPTQIVLPAADYLLSMEVGSFGFLNLNMEGDSHIRRLPVTWPGCRGPLGCRSLAWLAAKSLQPDLNEPGDEIYIDFDPRPDPVPIYSFLELYRLAAGPAGADPAARAAFFEKFRGKQVLIGDVNFLSRGSWLTPFSQANGRGDTSVEITAQAVLTLLSGRSFMVLSLPGQIVFIAALLFLSLIPLMLSPRCGPYPRLWLPSAVLPLYVVLGGLAFTRYLYLPVLPGALALILAQIFALMQRGLENRKAARTSLTALSLYLNPTLAREIVSHPELLSRGGQRREMTVFFSDLVGFTTLAEHLSPEDLVSALNRYFENMEPIISRHGGILDKFDGDSIMAFWGSPLLPHADHAASACLAALEQQAALARLNGQLRGEGRPPLSALMGLYSGPMVIGNIGAERRLNFTVMGDAVNLASRLVPVNKIYQTQIVIGEKCAREAGREVELRTLDRITVPGRQESLLIFEVMERRGLLADNARRGRDMYEKALNLYFKGDFQKALGLFETSLFFIQGDGPAELMSNRCREYLREPPAGDWQGVSSLAVK